MKDMPTMVVGSLPEIVTLNTPRRINKDNIDDVYIREYIKILGKLLNVKKDNLKDIKMVYLGGYEDIENTNTAKLYFNALKYFLKELGFGDLDKNKFVVLDRDLIISDINKAKDILENSDFIFLGIGQDRIFGELLNLIYNSGINLKNIILKNNILVASMCAGSVVSAEKIYGGKYDSFYYNRPDFVYPEYYNGLGINPVTIEPNFGSINKDEEKTKKFKETCLIPDSNSVAFYLASPNSMFVTNGDKIYASGAITLLMDSEEYVITDTLEKADITEINKYINIYNKNRSGVIKLLILNLLKNIEKFPIDLEREKSILDSFSQKERNLRLSEGVKKNNLKMMLKTQLLNLFNKDVTYGQLDRNTMNQDFINSLNLISDSEEELYFKYYLVAIIKSSSIMYKDNISKFLAIILECMVELVSSNTKIVYYFICCFSSFYSNSDMKKLLVLTKVQDSRRIQSLSDNNLYRRLVS